MQQVKSEAFLAGAQLIDSRSLPVPVRPPRRRVSTGFSRLWVLHHRLLRRSAWAVVALAACGGVVAMQEPIGVAAMTLGEAAQGRFADAGFAIGEISITGQTLSGEQAIFDALGVEPHTSTVSFDVEAARQRIAKLPAVEAVTVRKTYPGDIVVNITEKLPVARWRVDGITFVIDATGEQIGEDKGAYGDLPLVVGDGANDDAMVMIRVLDQHPALKDGLVALSRIADRRWDMIYDTGLRIQLPENGVAQALRKLELYQTQFQLLDRDITIVDLRVDRVVAVRPTVHEDETAEGEDGKKASPPSPYAPAPSATPFPVPPKPFADAAPSVLPPTPTTTTTAPQ